MSPSTQNIAIFASGRGSNAQKIIDHFKGSALARIALIVTGNPKAGVLNIAESEGIPTLIIDKTEFATGEKTVDDLEQYQIDLIVLAGFLWKLPPVLVAAWPGKIINIHPALLPKFGGAGMYGKHVFRAVHEAGERESGITIHYVDELYDHGQIIFQSHFTILPGDDPETIALKTHELEHEHFPLIIEQLLSPSGL